jgi:VWFA-related protein
LKKLKKNVLSFIFPLPSKKMKFYLKVSRLIFIILICALAAAAQISEREFSYKTGETIEITNLHGRVWIQADDTTKEKTIVQVSADKSLAESDIKFDNASGLKIEVLPQNSQARIDLTLKVPQRARVRVTTGEGEVRVSGDLESAEAATETGTIAAQVPLDDLKYNFLWTASRPRFVSDVALEEVKEKSAGRFSLKGKIFNEDAKKEEEIPETEETVDSETPTDTTEKTDQKKAKKKKPKTKEPKSKTISLNFTTARGIILLNVNPSEVPSDLRERPLTNAAKAIIRSGDSLLMEAIRRASPKFFGDYAATLPPFKTLPTLTQTTRNQDAVAAQVKRVLVRVTDLNNRAIADLSKNDFEVTESGTEREILSVEPTTAPFNLVLLLDVSGSVENYVDFIRKAARNFVGTVGKNDKIAIIIFNEDVKTISAFTTDKGKLSESLDTFDAGGSTAYYDAMAYTLVETLRPLRGERTAIVALTDGDDNRSFLSFDSLLGSIQESGALVYPLYVPSDLIASSATNNPDSTIDPLRTRYMALTSKAEIEGERLAQISGGVYYSIKQLTELQKAYNDIVVQLRTAYTVTFRSDLKEKRTDSITAPRLKIKVKRPNSFIKLGSVVEVSN